MMTDFGEQVEWCVMHPRFPDSPHRGPMTEAEAREWVQEATDDGIRAGLFFVAYRVVGPWQMEGPDGATP